MDNGAKMIELWHHIGRVDEMTLLINMLSFWTVFVLCCETRLKIVFIRECSSIWSMVTPVLGYVSPPGKSLDHTFLMLNNTYSLLFLRSVYLFCTIITKCNRLMFTDRCSRKYLSFIANSGNCSTFPILCIGLFYFDRVIQGWNRYVKLNIDITG